MGLFDRILGSGCSEASGEAKACKAFLRALHAGDYVLKRGKNVFNGICTRGTIDCMTCGKEICSACGKTIIKSGKMTQYCLDCLPKP